MGEEYAVFIDEAEYYEDDLDTKIITTPKLSDELSTVVEGDWVSRVGSLVVLRQTSDPVRSKLGGRGGWNYWEEVK